MALHYAILERTQVNNGRDYPAPRLPAVGGSSALAASAASAAITGPCELHIYPEDASRLACSKAAASVGAAAATSPLILDADARQVFVLDVGTWYIAWAAL